METLCLDTDFMVGVLRNNKECTEYLKSAEATHLIATTIINVFELFLGAYKSGRAENLIKTREFIATLEILPLDMKSAELAGQLCSGLEKAGNPIDFRDLLIGTIALMYNSKLKTFNTKHFKRIEGLALA